MNIKKSVMLGFLVLLIFACTTLTSCEGEVMSKEKALNNFSKLIETGNFNDISLTIYYMSPYTFTRIPLSVDDLINMNDVQKYVINSESLKEYINLLKQINKVDMTTVNQTLHMNARLYYVFKTNKGKVILDVAMWGEDNSMFVNKFWVKESQILYDAIIPFLPEKAVQELHKYLAPSITQ